MPHRLDQFEIRDVVGSGGMAVVYSGVHLRSGLPVAVKVMTANLARGPLHRRAFLREVRSVARLAHPGIVRVFDVGEIPPELQRTSGGEFASGAPYLVMEFVDGETLDRVVDLTWPQMAGMVLELLDALAHAHALGVVHRDLKPSNVLVDVANGLTPKLTDFGIARMFDIDHPSDPSDGDRRIAGTPNYMAPERVLGRWRDQGPWTDLYSLGILVWRFLTGEHPFTGTTQEVLVAHVRDPIPAFEPRVDVPDRLDLWLAGMLAKSTEQRFRCAADAAVAFRAVCRSPTRLAQAMGTEETVDGATLGLPHPEALPTLTAVLERPPAGEVGRQPGLVTDWPRPPIPSDWRKAPASRYMQRRLIDAGLGLFGLRVVPMVGRDAERDLLWGALVEVLRTRTPRIVHLRGPAGVGKTRLLEWFCRRATEVGAVDVCRVVHSEAGRRNDGLAGMLWRLFRAEGLDEEATTLRVREQVRELTHGQDALAEYDAAALAQIMTREGDDARRSVDFVSPNERFHAIYRTLRNRSERRAQVLWIEDAHLAIDAVRFVRFLFEETDADFPILVVMSSRTEGPFLSDSIRDDLAALAEHPSGQAVAVGRMDPATLRALVEGALGLSPELTDDVVRRAEGTPMFALQAVADWVDRGVLVPGAQGYRLADVPVDVPDDVHELWLRRLGRVVEGLAPHSVLAFDALLIAALLGRWVEYSEWSEALSRHAAPGRLQEGRLLEALLDELQRLGLAERQRDGWAFAHGAMRDSLLRVARSRGRAPKLHRICARSLEALHDITTPPIALRIATHLHESHDDVAALDVLLAAVRGAKASHDYDWLERLLTAADRIVATLQLDEADVRRGLLDVTRARLLTVRNRLLDAQRECERVIEDASRHGWTHVEGEATFQLGTNALSLGHTDRAVELFLRSRTLFEQLGEPHNLARAQEGIGYAYLHQGRFEAAKPFVERSGELYRTLDEPRGLAFNLYHRGIIARYEGDIAAARGYYDECMRLSSRLGFRDTLANAHNALGDLDRHDGDLEAAIVHYRDAYDLWCAIGASGANVSSINLGITLVQQGRWDDAAALLVPLTERLQADNAGMQLTFALAATLPVYAARREEALFDLALEQFDAHLATYDVHDPDLDLLRDLCVDLWTRAGDPDRAAQTHRIFRHA